MKLIHLFLLFIVIGISACESLITNVSPDKLPATESKLVVQSFISPQAERINVVVTESIPLFGETSGGSATIKNALVTISDDEKEMVIPFDSSSQLYTLSKTSFTIIAGKTYSLSVTDGKRSVRASCTVPINLASVKTYTIDTIYTTNGLEKDSTMSVKMTWEDIPSDVNYYRIRANAEMEYTIGEGASASTFHERRVRNKLSFRWDQTIGRNDLQSDVNLDGALFSSPIGRTSFPEKLTYNFGDGNSFVIDPKIKVISVTFEVDNTDSDYYKYHRSLELSDNENPFSEPALVYTNIVGGLGCFAAYNSGFLVFRPK